MLGVIERFVLFLLMMSLAAASEAQDKIKVIVDQDARGPCSTDMQSILMFAQSLQSSKQLF